MDAGIDPADLTPKSELDFAEELDIGNKTANEKKAWRDIWSAGQGLGSIDKVLSTVHLVDNLVNEYHAAITNHQKKHTGKFTKLINWLIHLY